MEIDTDELANTYVDLEDDELLRMHTSGMLTDIAYSVLEKELTQRGISIPPRIVESGEPKGRDQSLPAHWEGRANLASAFWILGVLGNLVFRFLIFPIIEIQGSTILAIIIFTIYLVFLIFTYVSIWRCSWNTSWKGWGYLARIYIVLDPILMLSPLIIWGVQKIIGI